MIILMNYKTSYIYSDILNILSLVAVPRWRFLPVANVIAMPANGAIQFNAEKQINVLHLK